MADKEVPTIRVVTFNQKSPAKKGEMSSCACVCQCQSDSSECPTKGTQDETQAIQKKQHSKGGKDSPRTFFRLAGDQDK